MALTNLNPVKGTNSGDSPNYGAGGSTTYTLAFNQNSTDLKNIEVQKMRADVIHKVQTMEDFLAPYVSHAYDLKGTFQWQYLTDKRNPKLQTSMPITIQAQAQTYEAVGLQTNPYIDDAWILDFVEANSAISIKDSQMVSMMFGYNRLATKIAVNAMLAPQLKRTTSATQWVKGDVSGTVTALPDTRIAGVVSKSATGTAKLEYPTFDEILDLMKSKFRDQNVSPNVRFCGLLTPGAENWLKKLVEYKNRDYIYSVMNDINTMAFTFGNIQWIKVNPETSPGSFYADKYLSIATQGNSTRALADATATSASNFDLTDTNHEVIPIWVMDNIRVGHFTMLDVLKILRVPYYRDDPAILMTKFLGGCRLQNDLQFNLVIPV